MLSYVVRRVLLALVTVLTAILIAFVLVHLTPDSPGELILGAGATKAQIAAENAKVGWDRPLLSQLGSYLGQLARGNLGISIIDGHSIGSDLLKRLPVTGLIAVLATLVSGVAGLMLGMAAAVRGGHTDRAINVSSGVALSLPPVSPARSTITLPGFIPSTASAVTSFGAGAGAPGAEAR